MMSLCCRARSFFGLVLLASAAVGCADAALSTPAMETQSIGQDTADRTSSNAGLHTEFYTSGPSSARSTTTFLPDMNENITISSFPKASVIKNIILERPVRLELLCSLVIIPDANMEKMEVAWKIGNKTIKTESINRNATKTKWCSRHELSIISKDELKNYTCIFKTKPEINATFNLQVPEIHIKSKSIISYVGDYVVLTCTVGEEGKHLPSSWVWYTSNGSEQIAVNATLTPEKYTIKSDQTNVTKLKILDLSEKDSGLYWCGAKFPVGESKGVVSLTVLTYMTPLKPFLAVAAEVIVLVTAIFVYEMMTRKKEAQVEVAKEIEQEETLKSEDSNGVENSSTRQRKT